MKLYYHPVSTTSRPVALFAAETGTALDMQVVDLFTGEHVQEPYAKLNPNKLVPMLEDGDFRLTESSAILKYLADKVGSPTYPKDLKQRARVNEMMDWFNANLYRDFAYGLVYPQLFPNQKRADPDQQDAVLAWGKEKSRNWLQILDRDLIGPNKKFLCGNDVTIADYFGACMLTVGEAIRCDFSPYPNVVRWLNNVKALPTWERTNEMFYGLAGSLQGMKFRAI